MIEMSQSSPLVAGMVPGVECQPLKKLKPEEDQLMPDNPDNRVRARERWLASGGCKTIP